MTLFLLVLVFFALIALLVAAGAFALFVYRLSEALPRRAEELLTRLDAIRAVAALNDRLDAIDDEIAGVREHVEMLDQFGANAAENQSKDVQRLHEHEEKLEALKLRVSRAVAQISGTGLVRFDDDGEPW
jgi:predicted  nucleic acid-binding Zn-ribbon protein